MKNMLAVLILLFLSSPVYGAISGVSIVTNYSGSDRAIMGTNSTLNITFTESIGTNYTNVSFPSSFNFTNLNIENVTNNTGATLMTTTATTVNFTYEGIAPGVIYLNFTTNMKLPPTSGAYPITIATNATTTPTTVYVCARDTSKPHLISANNSVYTTTCGGVTETFGTGTSSIYLSGTGIANLTFFAPSISGVSNVTQGYGATNASSIKNVNATGGGSVVSYVVVNSGVTDPVITVSQANEISSLPYAIATAGVISSVVLVYVLRRRRH